MVYIARTQRVLIGYLFLLIIFTISINDFSIWLLYVQILFALLIFCSLFIKYKFEIKEDYLAYQILFFTLPIYKTKIHANQIIQIKFKRIGWVTKGVIIRRNKGFNIRIVNFTPNGVLTDLIDFAIKNDVSYSKTKDYIILEK